MSRNWKQELEQHHGRILLPNGIWKTPKHPILQIWDGDVWAHPNEILRLPQFEQEFAVALESFVNAGICGASGEAKVAFIASECTFRATGDFFDPDCLFVDRNYLPRNPEDEVTLCCVLGKEARRTINRLCDRIDCPRRSVAQGRVAKRMCLFSWVWKVAAARAGFPEFCELEFK